LHFGFICLVIPRLGESEGSFLSSPLFPLLFLKEGEPPYIIPPSASSQFEGPSQTNFFPGQAFLFFSSPNFYESQLDFLQNFNLWAIPFSPLFAPTLTCRSHFPFSKRVNSRDFSLRAHDAGSVPIEMLCCDMRWRPAH